jgi:hypothetical protein
MLAESIDRWNRELREEGVQEGLQKGVQEGLQKGVQEGEARMLLQLLRLKFGSLTPEIEERVGSANADSLLEWGARVLSAGTLADIFEDEGPAIRPGA